MPNLAEKTPTRRTPRDRCFWLYKDMPPIVVVRRENTLEKVFYLSQEGHEE